MSDLSRRFSLLGFQRDHRGWKFKTPYLTFHPVSYGTATLARLSVGLHPEGHRLMLHYFPVADYGATFHDHPWGFRTLVLWGHYVDLSLDANGNEVIEHMTAGKLRYRPARHRHKTKTLRRTVTLVLTNPTERRWCEGDTLDWKCDGVAADFNETLGHINA